MSTNKPASDADELDGVDVFAHYGRAKVSVVLGIIAFFPGILLAFVYVVFALIALVVGIAGFFYGVTALARSVRGTRPWLVAAVGTLVSGIDVMLLIFLLMLSVIAVGHS